MKRSSVAERAHRPSRMDSLNTFRGNGDKRTDSSKSNTFVLFCNPNACFYEYSHYQSEWVQYYTQRLGFNVITFNYRGYGRSDMSSSSKFL